MGHHDVEDNCHLIVNYLEDFKVPDDAIFEIGSVSFIVDLTVSELESLDEIQIKEIAQNVITSFQSALDYKTSDVVKISKVHYRYSCLEIIVSVVIFSGLGAAWVLKHYSTIKNNIIEAAQDIELLKIKIKEREIKKGTFVRNRLYEKENVLKEIEIYLEKQRNSNKD